MANFNQSINEGVCIDEEVFFGSITDKERKIREHFENAYRNEKISGELLKVAENDISRNDSLYKSFSIDESKYDSFDDSLNEEIDKKPQGTKHVSLRKSIDKLKHKKHAFYDSLEDVCSLASNIEKCSENDSNVNDKQHIIDDSLRNPPIAVANKNYCVSEQIHFDDDSLAVIELENTFDDSLEEFNVLSSVELEEINDVEIVVAENQNVASKVEQNHVFASRNLFETSVQVIYEKKLGTDIADQEESSDDKNMLYDSLSNSDFKDILKDSLGESEKSFDNLLKHASDASIANIQKSEQLSALQSIKIEEINDAKSMTVQCEKDQSSNCTSINHFDTSVQIICEKEQETGADDLVESVNDKVILYDSLSSSDFKDILKDSLEESEISIANLKHVSNISTTNTEKSEQMFITSDVLDHSVQIVYENLQNFRCNENISVDVTKSKCNNILQDSFENLKNGNRDLNDQRSNETEWKGISQSCNVDADKNATDDNQSTLYLEDTNANQNCKENVEKMYSVKTELDFPVSAVENSNFKKAFTVDSCQFKLLNDNLTAEKDLKFQLHIEVTVGDKKCKIAAEDIKLLPVTSLNSKISGSDSLTLDLAKSKNCSKKGTPEVLDSCSSKLFDANQEHNLNKENICSESNEINLCDKFKISSTANITQRVKESFSQLGDSDLKFNFHEQVNDGNLLQALDLHDISASFLNESVIQSNDSVVSLNLCSKGQDIQRLQMALFKSESKENVPELVHCFEDKDFCSPNKKTNHSKVNYNKTPKGLQKSPSFKETIKKTGTKIPVRKVENFAVPVTPSSKLAKQIPCSLSTEKVKKHLHPHTPHSAEKKTLTTPNKTPHFCKVRNTIFSKVPQIVPSKKYMNIQSPVAQYIRNTPGSEKTPTLDPVLRDCMNVHQQNESPCHLHQTTKGGSIKSTKRKM